MEKNKSEYNVQILLIGLEIITLVFFIMFGFTQNRQTRQSLELTREIAKKEMRAYLNINEFIFKQNDLNKLIDFTALIGNTGKTPANNIKIWTYPTLRIENINQDTLLKYIHSAKPIEGIAFIGADQSDKLRIFSTDSLWVKSKYSQILKGSLQFNLIVYISYTDVFKDDHFTQLHFRYDPNSDNFENEKLYTNYN